MRLQHLTPMLRTADLKASLEFYTTILGFTCDGSSDEWGWTSVKRDDVCIMFALPDPGEPFARPVFTGSLYIHASDVDALWTRLKDVVRVCYPIADFEYGMREFGIYDNNGYLLQFGQEGPDALQAVEIA
jgi:catechol 2,3-dioxygenase-like lactoylglutathione lyase family enzyme